MKLTNIEIKGKSYAVEVTSEGRFFAEHDGERVWAASLNELRKGLADRVKRAMKKLDIAAALIEQKSYHNEDIKVILGKIVGIHASNDNILFRRDATGKVEQLSSWAVETLFPPQYAAEYVRLINARIVATKAVEDYKQKHAINGRDLIKKFLNPEGGSDDSRS